MTDSLFVCLCTAAGQDVSWPETSIWVMLGGLAYRSFIYKYIYRVSQKTREFSDELDISINVELTSTFLLYRGLVHQHHWILNVSTNIPCIPLYLPVSPCIYQYPPGSPSIPLYLRVSPCIFQYPPVSTCIPSILLYLPVSPCIPLYLPLSPCIYLSEVNVLEVEWSGKEHNNKKNDA